MRMFNPPHPGEVLHDYLEGVSITQATSRLQISRSRLSRILSVLHSRIYDKIKGKLYFQKNEFPLSAPEIKV